MSCGGAGALPGTATVDDSFRISAALPGSLSPFATPDDALFTHDGFDGGSAATVPVGFHGAFAVAAFSSASFSTVW